MYYICAYLPDQFYGTFYGPFYSSKHLPSFLGTRVVVAKDIKMKYV